MTLVDDAHEAAGYLAKVSISYAEWLQRCQNANYDKRATNWWKGLSALKAGGVPVSLPADPVPMAPPPPPSGFPTVPSQTVGRNGLYFYNLWDVGKAIYYAKQYGFWVAILVNETARTPMRDGAPLSKSYIFDQRDRFKQAGVPVIASGWATPDNLDAQAAFIGEMAQGFDEYMLNIEADWAYPAPGFSVNDVFAPKVRAALGPAMPLSLCIDWGNPVHFTPWLNAGCSAVRVQCYLEQYPHKNPADALVKLKQAQHDLPNGVPDGMGEIVYGKYGDFRKPLSSWTAQDDAAGKPPRSVWAAEFCDDADAAWLAR